MFQTEFVQEIKTHILFSITFFLISAAYERTWKSIVDRSNMAHAHCMLDT